MVEWLTLLDNAIIYGRGIESHYVQLDNLLVLLYYSIYF